MYLFRNNTENENSLRNNQQSTSMKEIEEPPSFVAGEVEEALHHEDRKSLPSEYRKDEQKSYDNEE